MERSRRRLIGLSSVMAVLWLILLLLFGILTRRLLQVQQGWSMDVMVGFVFVVLMLFILIGCFIMIAIIVRNERKIIAFRERMVHSIIHELKTPITTMSLACQLLQDRSVQKDVETADSYLKIIKAESDAMKDLVDEVLTVFRNKEIPQREMKQFSIHDLLHAVVEIHSLALKECGAKVIFDLQAEQDEVLGDRSHLCNAFSNLIDNAIKYRQGDLVLNISTKNENQTIEIRIADNGIGIDKKDQKLVFEPFSRINTDNSQYVKGYGLGLSYVEYVVGYHKGKIKIESELGKGATFIVSLPIII